MVRGTQALGADALLAIPGMAMHSRRRLHPTPQQQLQQYSSHQAVGIDLKGGLKIASGWVSAETLYIYLRIGSSIGHMVGAFLVMFYWASLGGGSNAPRLATHAYFATDYHSALTYISNRGYRTIPLVLGSDPWNTSTFVQLDAAGMIRQAQPLPIVYASDETGTPTLSPTGCMGLGRLGGDVAGESHPNSEDVSMWRACKAGDVPAALFDVGYSFNTLTVFGVNNMLGLLYNTLFLTWAISLAVLPPIMRINPWPPLALAFIGGNLVAMLAIPFTQRSMYLPPNNAALVAVLHMVTGLVVMAIAAPTPRTNRVANQEEPGGGQLVVVPSGSNSAIVTLHSLGRHASGLTIWTWSRGSSMDTRGKNAFYIEGGKSVPVAAAPSEPRGGVCSRQGDNERLLSISANGKSATTMPIDWLKTNFVEQSIESMDMVLVRYLEYSMTAGLFLIAIMMALYPNGEAHTYQIIYQGMLLCNLVAIPMVGGATRAMHAFRGSQGSSKFQEDYGIWASLAIGGLLISSFVFFFASFYPFGLVVMPLLSAPGIPLPVVLAVVLVFVIFCAFAVVGGVSTVRIAVAVRASNASTQSDIEWYVWMQLICFEFLNWGKWWISMVVVFSVIQAVGLK